MEWAALIIFVCVTVFTPGPGNVTSAAMGMLYGYKRTLRFLVGMVFGALCLLSLSALVSQELLARFPAVEPLLRIGGVTYLLWMTYETARATYSFDEGGRKPMAFRHGFWIQALNPKGMVFGMTFYSTMLPSVAPAPEATALSLVVMAMLTFTSVSLWALVGTRIGKFLHVPGVRPAVNCVLVLLLLYCAYSMSGVQDYIA